jgi:Domain of unknown function (DUF4351)
MAEAGSSLFECYSDPPSVEDVEACVRKQLVVHQERKLAARRGRQDRPPKPRLWLMSAGRPDAALHAYEARPMPDWPLGFWQARPAARTHWVLVHELPAVPDTLLLRLFGRGSTLAQALGELEALAPDALERRVALPLVLAFRRGISQNDLEDQDMQAYQRLMAVYDDMINEAQEKGLKKGRREGLMEGERAVLVRQLTRRFGPLPRKAAARIRRADQATLERWSDRVLTAGTLDDVLD